jgi:hypothetical protein
MKRIFSLILLLPLAFLAARAQTLPLPAPDSLHLPLPADSVSFQPLPAPVVIYPLHEELMAQLALEHQAAQEKLLAQLDKRNGFRDVDFYTDLKFFKKVVQEWKEGDDRNYRRLTDQLSINGMPLSEIVYGFHKSKLHHIYLTAPGIENSRRMLAFFQSIYGIGERVYEETVEFDNMIQWTGKKVILTYSEVASKKEGFFHFFVVSSQAELPRNKPATKNLSKK